MPVEIKWIECFIGLKVFILEFNDLRGNDRQSLPVIISSITKNLANLENLNCVEIGQKPGNTSCTFDDTDIDE